MSNHLISIWNWILPILFECPQQPISRYLLTTKYILTNIDSLSVFLESLGCQTFAKKNAFFNIEYYYENWEQRKISDFNHGMKIMSFMKKVFWVWHVKMLISKCPLFWLLFTPLFLKGQGKLTKHQKIQKIHWDLLYS